MLLVLLSDWWHSSSNRPSKTGQPGDSGRIVGDSDEGLLDGTPRRILRVSRHTDGAVPVEKPWFALVPNKQPNR